MIFKKRVANSNKKVKHSRKQIDLRSQENMAELEKISEAAENVQHKQEIKFGLNFSGGNNKKSKFGLNFALKNDNLNLNFKISNELIEFSESYIFDDIMRESLALNIPTGTAKVFAEKVARVVKQKIGSQKLRQAEVDQQIAVEIEKYNDDLAYVYKNRGKII